MKLFVYLLLIITLTRFSASMNPSIINGQEATENQFPYQVGLYLESEYYTGYLCTGALVSPIFIITTADCFYILDLEYDIVFALLGSINLYGGTRKDARKLILHPEYYEDMFGRDVSNNIALAEIDSVDYSESIMNIALPDFSEYYDYETSVVITSGWGTTNFTVGGLSPTLQYTTLLVIRNEACSKLLYGNESKIIKDWICATSSIESGVCYNDEGNPLAARDSKVLIGLYVWRKTSDCTGYYLTYFTNITYHRQWIWERVGI